MLSDDLREKLSIEERYVEALELRLDGLGPDRIAKTLDIPKHEIVYGWIYQGSEPLGNMNVPDFRLAKDIVPILAATNTDAGVTEREHIMLDSVDYLLAKNFASSVSGALGKEVDVRMHESKPGIWAVNCDSAFLADTAERVREEPELINRFLTDEESKVEYCRLFFAYDGGPNVGFYEEKEAIRVGISVNEDRGRLVVLRDILGDLGVPASEPHFYDNVHRITITGKESVGLFADLIGIEGYKGQKLEDALWLKDRMEDRISEGMENREALEWARALWETYYVFDKGHGYVPAWLLEAYQTAYSDIPLEDKLELVEKIYEDVSREASSLRSTIRY